MPTSSRSVADHALDGRPSVQESGTEPTRVPAPDHRSDRHKRPAIVRWTRRKIDDWPRFLWWPLVVWAFLVLVCGLVLAQVDAMARHGSVDRFHAGVQTSADFTGAYISDLFRQQRQAAGDHLSGRKVTPTDLEWAVAGIRCSAAGTTDGKGMLLAVIPSAPALIGTDQTKILEHFRIAIQENRPGISHVVISPVLGRPAVGFAIPFVTPYGRRAFSCAMSVRDSPIGAGIERTGTRAHERIRLIDDSGNLVTGTDDTADNKITSLAAVAPELASALRRHPSGHYSVAGEQRYYDSVQVPGTSWRTVASISEKRLYGTQDRAMSVYLKALVGGAALGLVAAVMIGAGRRRRVLADLRIRSLNRRLERSNKDMQEFTYSVAHDLRAPLRAVSGFSQILATRYADRLDETGQGYVKRIDRAGQKMAALIDDLLDLSRVARVELQLERVDLSELARTIVNRLKDQDPDRRVSFWTTDGVVAWADRELIVTVLENLFGNAWKFTARRQDATIEFGAFDADEDQIGCYVRDNGVGFDQAYADKLFTPFQRLHSDRDYPGTGIGLASARRIIERHGGRIWADGEPGAGATFSFTLPSGDTGAVEE